MYGFKEKKKIHQEMINKDHAEADLRLLQLASPLHFQIKRFSRDPRRYAEEILYALLDLKSQEDIRLNRRQHTSDPEKKESDKDSEGEKEPAAGPKDKPEGEKEPADESESKSEGGTETAANEEQKKSSRKKTNIQT